jgi:hypothetical protein
MQSDNYRGIDGPRGIDARKEGSELDRETRRKCFVLLRLRYIRTTAYIQCSNLRRFREAKVGSEAASTLQPRCPLRGRKQPWHRRSIRRPRVRSSAQKLCVLRPPSALLRFFNHLHQDSTTYKRARGRGPSLPPNRPATTEPMNEMACWQQLTRRSVASKV